MMEDLYPLYAEGKLDPQSEAILRQIANAKAKPLSELTPREARACFLEPSWLGTVSKGVALERLTIPRPSGGIPICVYTPAGDGPLPLLVFFHGGGFVQGALEEFHPFCTMLADGACCIVVSVGYRLAPEHKHPAAVDDAVGALRWIAANAGDLHGDAARLAVAGDSAGGNLAAVSALVARDDGFPSLTQQVLICPWVDVSSFDTPSYRWFGDGLWLSTASMAWYRDHYLQHRDSAKTYRASPLLAEDLSRLPPALVITAEFDVLRDEGEAYAQRLRAAGVAVRCTRYDGMLHDFVTLPGIFPRARVAIDEICASLRAASNAGTVPDPL